MLPLQYPQPASAGAIRTRRSTQTSPPPQPRFSITRTTTRTIFLMRLVSNLNPLRGCNSNLAQYSNTPPPQPHLSSTSTNAKRDAPGELRELEADKVITRTVYPEVPTRV